jgi:zinc protease
MSPLPGHAPSPGRLRPYEMPMPQRHRLANGLTVVSAEHAITPVVAIRIMIDAGTVREPAARAGLSSLVAGSLDAGAAGRSGETLAWEFERLGVEVHTEATTEAVWISATVAAERLRPTLSLLADIVRRPDFPAADVDRVRNEQLAEILQRRDEPRALANDLILHFLYGDDDAYGRPVVGLADRVRQLTQEDVARFHQTEFSPDRTTVVLAGAIDAAEAPAAVESEFGDWHHSPVSPGRPTAGSSPLPAAVHVVDRAGSVQSEIRVAHAGVERRHEDYFAIRVMNTIFGGAFTSRLNLSLRERHGFTYGVRSGFAFRRNPGPFTIQTAVAKDVTHRAVDEIARELQLMHDNGATEEEVANARDYLAGVVPLESQTADQLASRFAEIVLFDLPDDYYRGYRAAIQAVTVDDVARVAREHLHPDRLTYCIVGDAAAVREPLEGTVGNITVHPHAQ